MIFKGRGRGIELKSRILQKGEQERHIKTTIGTTETGEKKHGQNA